VAFKPAIPALETSGNSLFKIQPSETQPSSLFGGKALTPAPAEEPKK